MQSLPEIGTRVRYRSARLAGRECVGTVRRLYPGDRCVDDNPDIIRPVRVGDPEWAEYWSASVEVDEPLPDWWQYAGTSRFAPSIAELEPA